MALAGARLGTNLSVGAFVPQVYSATMQDKFYASSSVAAIANTKWQGEITGFGDKVIIRKVPTINIGDYVINSPLVRQNVSDEQIVLNIDQQKYYSFTVDYIDDYQSDLALIEKISEDASWQMRVAIDAAVLQGIPADIALGNSIGATIGTLTAVQMTAALSLTTLLLAGQVLDTNNVPRDGNRWAVVTPAWANWLKQSNLAQAYFSGDTTSMARNGLIGEIDGMKIYISNNLTRANTATSGAGSLCLAGHTSALAFASQFVKHRQIELQETFGWGIDGLNVFGYKLVKPEAAVLMSMY